MTLEELLRANGASDEDLKLLSTPALQKAFAAKDAEAQQSINDYKAKADEWYEKVATPNLTAAQQKAITAEAEAARLRSLVAQSQDEGLRKVAESMGYKLDGSAAPKKDEPATLDARYVTTEQLTGIADNVGNNLARMQDMVLEHMQLFPGSRLNVQQLRNEAKGGNIYDHWEKKYNVPAARDKQSADAKSADEAKIRKDERDKVTMEFANAAANPNMVPGSTSSNVFVPRGNTGRDKAPWESNLDGQNGATDRTTRATKNFVERQSTRTN